jgi:SRSO17 transposase
VKAWADELAVAAGRIGRHFARSEPRRRAIGYVRGLLSGMDRKNGWQLAEYLGDPNPDGVQHLLARADWDADAVRDDLIGYVAEHFGHPDGVLVVDETGFLKKGTQSCGVARQYTGMAGRIENCQVGVFLGYVTAKGRALLDRALYLPQEWAADPDRRKAAGVPTAVRFATKLAVARQMIDRALDAGVPARWVTADVGYDSDYALRKAVEDRALGYVVGVRADHAVAVGSRRVRACALLAEVPADGWHRPSWDAGAQGLRRYDWALCRTNCQEPKPFARWMLIRRSVADPTEVAYFTCGGPPAATLADLIGVAGARWAVEDLLDMAKGDCGLDGYEVRTWAGWYRHVTLSLFALAVAAVTGSRVTKPAGRKKGAPASSR